MGLGIAGLERNGLATGGEGLVEFSLVIQGVCEIKVSLGEVGPEHDSLMIGGDGLIKLPPGSQGIAEIAVGFGIIGLQRDGLTDQTDRNVAVSHLKGNNSEMVHRMNMFRLPG